MRVITLIISPGENNWKLLHLCDVYRVILRSITWFSVNIKIHLSQVCNIQRHEADSEQNSILGLRPATLLKKRLWHRCFPVNFAKFLRTTFSYRTPPLATSVVFIVKPSVDDK